MNPEKWVDEYGNHLYRYALIRLRSSARAEEAVQETLLAAWRGRDGFAGKSSVRAWLFGILRHKIVDQLRIAARENLESDLEQEGRLDDFFDSAGRHVATPRRWSGDPRADLEQREFWDCLAACMGKLPERLGTAFALREIDGLDREDICKVLAITANNYWVMLHRARLLLRRCLEANWFGRDSERKSG